MPRPYAVKARRFYTAGSDHPDLLAEPLDPPIEWLRDHVRARRLEPARPVGPRPRVPHTASWEPCGRCGASRGPQDRTPEPAMEPRCGECSEIDRLRSLDRAKVAKRLEAHALDRGVLERSQPVYRYERFGYGRRATAKVRYEFATDPCATCGRMIHHNAHVLLANAKTFVFHKSCWETGQTRLSWLTCWALGVHVDDPTLVPDPETAMQMLEERTVAMRRSAPTVPMQAT